MNANKDKTGVTLIEMLIVIVVIAILASMVAGIASRVDNQAKMQLTESTIKLLSAALEEFRDYDYTFQNPNYSGLDFPPDFDGFLQVEIETDLILEFGGAFITGGVHDPNYSGCEVMYLFLNRVTECSQTLRKIGSSLVTSKGRDNQELTITIELEGPSFPLLRVIDPWGQTLRYLAFGRNFPLIISAGPDKVFGTADDISNR